MKIIKKWGVRGAKMPYFLKASMKIASKINDLQLMGGLSGGFSIYIYIIYILRKQSDPKKIYIK